MEDTGWKESGIIALIGFMGAGKSAVGRLLSARLGLSFVDLDEVISAMAGKDITEIFAAEGEEGFRERESEALKRVLDGGSKVVSCGGGVVLRDENVELLRRKSRVFLLRVSPERALERLAGSEGRPLLDADDVEERIRELMEERAERYHAAAHAEFDASDADPEEIAEEIAAVWSN